MMCQFIVLMNLNLIAIPLSGKEKNIRKHERVDWTREKNSRKDAPSCSQSRVSYVILLVVGFVNQLAGFTGTCSVALQRDNKRRCDG
jgi:hypothetical protein